MAGNLPSSPSSRQPDPLPQPESQPDDAPSSSLSDEGEPEEQNAPSIQGVVSEDGLTYRNDAVGLTVQLPPSSTGRPWYFRPSGTDQREGMQLIICYEENGGGPMAFLSVWSHPDYESCHPDPLAPDALLGENSQWVFSVSLAFSFAPVYDPDTQDHENYQTMLKELSPLESGQGVAITEPTATQSTSGETLQCQEIQ